MARQSRQIRIGTVLVGGGAPISLQTMAKADPARVDVIVSQLLEARAAGCDIARVAVPDLAAAHTIPEIRDRCHLPIVADVHFDFRLAVEAARCGADGLRVNPGNLGGEAALAAVVEAAAQAGIPIRVGVNAGSLPKHGGAAVAEVGGVAQSSMASAKQPSSTIAEMMVRAARDMVEPIQRRGFHAIKVSLKAFDVPTTVEANRLFAAESDLPLHLGITEAGPDLSGAVRSAAALSLLLAQGIGDTVRISLTAPPVEEVRAGRALLVALGLRRGGVVVSCPTCGRTGADLISVARRVEALVHELGLELTVAVMGCEVNGPGEARAADVGIAFGPSGEGLMFEHGRIAGKHSNQRLEAALTEYLRGRRRPASTAGRRDGSEDSAREEEHDGR